MIRILKAGLMASVLSLLVLAVAGCGGNVAASTNEAHGVSVNVTLASFKINPSMTSLPAGKITFHAKNTDVVKHEMLVIPVAKTALELPYDRVISRVAEDEINSLGEVPEIEGGTAGDVTLDLAPGNYLLICNLVGHYGAGMHTLITVK